MNELLKEIQQHNELYRVGHPEISDAQYDALVERLKELDPDNAWFRQTEPAQVSQSRKRKLSVPMKSLNKVKSLNAIKQWLDSLGIPKSASVVVMPKYDGVSWLHDEVNHTTYSRGGAENEGQDCSRHFEKGGFCERSCQENFPADFTFGELVFSRRNWEDEMAGRISDSTGEPYRSPRNTIAGFINRDDPPEDIAHASFMRYGVDEKSLSHWTRFSSLLEDITIEYNVWSHTKEGLKFPFVVLSAQELSEECLVDMFKAWRTIFYIDGLVIYLDDLNLWRAVGRHRTTGNPLYAVAYKHPDFTDTFETTVLGIEWNVSKAGALKPVVQIEPVDTGDCIMENPTGNNAGWCCSRGLGVGAKVLVTRSGGVIPKILQTLEPVECVLPETCPVCGSDLSFDDNHIDLYCENPDCDGIKLAKINHFFSTVGVENIGSEAFSKLFAAGFKSIKSLLDINESELMMIDGFGEGTASNFISEMKKIMSGIDLATLMHASDCFKGIGRIKARKILDEMTLTQYDYFISGRVYPNYPSPKELAVLPVTQQNFIKGVAPFHRFLSETKIPIIRLSQFINNNGKYSGMNVCFSGVRDRELEDEIIGEGGKVSTTVGGKTTHLIVKDPSVTTGKIAKAKDLGVTILSISEFKAL